jgi:hypothetical protein
MNRAIVLKLAFGVCLASAPLARHANAQGPWGWWPDPAFNRGLSVWVAFSDDYAKIWSDHSAVDHAVNAMSLQGIQVAFVALSSATATPHLQALSNPTDPVTVDVQYLVDQLAGNNIAACATILSDDFTGSADQMARYTFVDYLVDFDNSLAAGHAGFNCVSTDLEMQAGSQTTAVYDAWKLFHENMRNEISSDGSVLQLMAWIQGPDTLIEKMSPADRQQLMAREGITQDAADSSLYDGAFAYFTTQNGVPIFDAVIAMWYFTPPNSYYTRLDHNVSELQNMGLPNLYLIAGLSVQNSTGVCCSGCVSGSADYNDRLSYNDTVRMQFPNFIGTGVFKWPIEASWTCPK